MFKMALGFWLLVPVLAVLYHVGPGQEKMELDAFDAQLQKARHQVTLGNLSEAESLYGKAIELLPETRTELKYQLQIDLAKVHMKNGKLPKAYNHLVGLVEDLKNNKKVDSKILTDAKATLANARYYVTWSLRLEGAPRDQWEPEIEAARQSYRVLAEEASEAKQSVQAGDYQEDLEAAIRLARMETGELQALDLPRQCKGCCCTGNCKGKSKKKGKKKCKKKGKSKGQKPDGRVGMGQLEEDRGS